MARVQGRPIVAYLQASEAERRWATHTCALWGGGGPTEFVETTCINTCFNVWRPARRRRSRSASTATAA
ncbi:MAG TPA: hypothetical protein VMV81_09825 [Phycisphaerae bacterium]|nr:hypothetical protein [Phycisphaerae bacterium]